MVFFIDTSCTVYYDVYSQNDYNKAMDNKLNEEGQDLETFLQNYDAGRWPRPSCTVDMILFTVDQSRLKLLLIRRRNHPWIGDWAMPGGFVNIDEDLDDAALRELKEETSMDDLLYFHQLYTFGNVDRDPRTRVITTVYVSMTPAENIMRTQAGDDAGDALWFTIAKQPLSANDQERRSVLSICSEERSIRMEYEITDYAKGNHVITRSRLLDTSNACLAADHIKAVNMALDQLRNRSSLTGIIFNLLPREVTLREIQDAYESIRGHKLDTGNFRRDIRRMLVPTGNTRKVRGRNAALYTFNPLFENLEENL